MNFLRRVLVVLALAVAVTSCGQAPDPRPSVVLILVDQLRADAAERWMPATRALAERGVRFEEMRAVAPWTYPSVTSLFSGLYPQQHGADADQQGKRLTTISGDVPLLPRTLQAAGYHTAAFVTNPFFHEWNHPFAGSFDKFDASFIGDQGPTRGHGDKVWTKRMYSDSVNAAVRAYFDGRALGAAEFVYVHYIDVHGRKESAERWRDAPFEPSYEAATRYVDGKIAELYALFRARYGDKLLFLVTSDHGQDLDDDLELGEGQPWRQRKASLHDFNLRIPLWILPSSLVQEPRVITQPCANIDVAATLLDWLGLPPPLGPGQSLCGAIRGAPYDGRTRALYARNSTGGRLEEGVVHAQQKLLRYHDPVGGAVLARHLFDLAADPRETQLLRADTSAMEALLQATAEARGGSFPANFEKLDFELEQRLRDLGYAGEDAVPEPAEPQAERK
ncbi:MAG: hypothetical protein EXS08_05980 [Planctomycetes bacterium]|nr:hypothetical protein [Planctomycetota bacterium]